MNRDLAHNSLVRFGYLPEFLGVDALLFLGDERSLSDFSKSLSGLSLGMHDIKGLIHCSGEDAELSFEVISGPSAAVIEKADSGMVKIALKLSQYDLKELSEKVSVLSKYPRPAHQYIESKSLLPLVIIVSKGEYDDLF